MIFWFTGLSGSGKTTLSSALAEFLRARNHPVFLLDGDTVRMLLSPDLGYGMRDRAENIRRLAACAALAENSGIIVCVACISPLASQRALARSMCRDFHEIHVDAPLEACRLRDPKGLYKKVATGRISGFTGVSSPYEAPKSPELRLDTATLAEQDAKDLLFSYALSIINAANGEHP